LNTGSPHHVQLVDDLENYNIKENGAAIRYGDLYGRLEAMSILSNKLTKILFVAPMNAVLKMKHSLVVQALQQLQ
jgi:hypothetical protein